MSAERVNMEKVLEKLIDTIDEMTDKGIMASEKIEDFLLNDEKGDLGELLIDIERKINDMNSLMIDVRIIINKIRKDYLNSP